MKLFLAMAIFAATSSGCGYTPPPPTASQTAQANLMSPAQERNATAAAEAYDSLEIDPNNNVEIQEIKKYVKQMTTPGQIGYVVLFTLGRPIEYDIVKGPVIDCARELTPMQHPAAANVNIVNPTSSAGNTYTQDQYMTDSPNDEGTYGGNEHCHFYYTEDGVLKRWTGEFLYSDQPIRLSEEPLVINIHLTKEGVRK